MMEESISKFCEDPSKENLVSLLIDLGKASVLVPFTVVNGKDIHMETDVLVNPDNISHYPIFTAKSEVPKEYYRAFIWKERSFLDCITSALDKDISVVLNAYTQNIVFPKELLEIINRNAPQ